MCVVVGVKQFRLFLYWQATVATGQLQAATLVCRSLNMALGGQATSGFSGQEKILVLCGFLGCESCRLVGGYQHFGGK
jgi:hypothetical protein